MPVVDWLKYPKNWKQIALEVRNRADWKCSMCGKQCRRPGEPFDTHRNTATVAHLNHDESDCRSDNLACTCAPCHLRYDAMHHAVNAAKTRVMKRKKAAVAAGQQCLPFLSEG